MNLTLVSAFRRFGAKPVNRLGGLSAMATDGSMVLNYLPAHFGHPAPGKLRYEARLSTAQAGPKDVSMLGVHLTRARDAALPIRMVVASPYREKAGTKGRSYSVRPDLIGKIVEFDGDRFAIDFTRQEADKPAAPAKRRK